MVRPYSDSPDIPQKRISYLTVGIFLFGLVIGYRLFSKSVLEHGHYTALAKNQYYVEKNNPSSRGTIYAHDQTATDGIVPIAINLVKYDISLVPSNIKNKEDVAKKLAPLIGLKEEDIFSKINNNKKYLPPIVKGLEKDVADKIADLNLIGVYISSEDSRYYPDNNLASHVLGFVNSAGNGNYGIEGYYDDQLKGRGGSIEGEKDTLGRIFSVTKEDQAMNGTDLTLTIDRNVQYIAEQKLKEAIDTYQADDGSITIVEPQTGKILAMAGYPDFDPNKYNEVPTDKADVFLNPVISKVYEPGSIFKPLVMSMAVNEGEVEPDTEGTFSNAVEVEGYQINTAQNKAFGTETMTQVLENSDNVAMVWVANKIGNDVMSKYINSFGFGHKYGIDLTGETTGYVAPVKNWKDINRATISFGQGISVTPLQILMGVSAIANNGVLMKPYVVDKMTRPEQGEVVTKPTELGKVITEDSAKKVNGMMIAVVKLGHGKKAAVPGYLVAGKTGTAQIPRPGSEGGGYYDDKHIGSFAGFFPADNPRFAMLVRLTNPKNTEWAEASAAPTFGEVAKWLLDYYQIPPNQSE